MVLLVSADTQVLVATRAYRAGQAHLASVDGQEQAVSLVTRVHQALQDTQALVDGQEHLASLVTRVPVELQVGPVLQV